MLFKKSLRNIGSALLIPAALALLGWFAYAYEIIQEVNSLLFTAVCVVLVTLSITFRRYVRELRAKARMSRRLSRERAEHAEKQIRALRLHIEQLEQNSERLKESRAQLRHTAYHDALTGLPNRDYFVDTLRRLIEERMEHPAVSYAILFLDLNGFRKINDSLGHALGDQLVKQISGRLSKLATSAAIVGRFGGDEFGIILTDEADERGAKAFAAVVAHAIAQPFFLDGKQVFVSASIGIALGSLNYDVPEEILSAADIAMYHAKDHGKEYVVFDERMRVRSVSLLQLETDLRYAVERDEFEVYYQPIVDLKSLKLRGFEALVRWNHPSLGILSPDRFLPLSEATGLIVPMTLQILEKACRQTVAWQNDLKEAGPKFVSVNISASHFADPLLVKQIEDVLTKTGIEAHSLKLEITETAIMENGENAVATLLQIKGLGVRLSIDDFGTGYSSLGYLQRFPIDTLKVDRVFVRAMEEGQQNGEIVRAVLALADTLHLEVVAEGIESIHQLHQLRILSCEYGQGYLFSVPLNASNAEGLLADPGRWQRLLAGADFVPFDQFQHSGYQLH